MPARVDLDSLVPQKFNSVEILSYDSVELANIIGEKYNFRSLHVDLIKTQTNAEVRIFRSWVSGLLAGSLWLFIICIGGWYVAQTGKISSAMLEDSNIRDNPQESRFDVYEKASANIEDTAKTIYSLMTPLATAVTGFYFVFNSKTSESEEEN